LNLEIDRHCFVCGPENPSGLHIQFETEGGRASAEFIPAPEHQGYTGVSHGGILAAVLDEAMVYAAVSLGHWVATAEMTIRFSKPVAVGQPVRVRAEVTRHQRRLVECRAEVSDAAGVVLASATGKLVQGRALREGERESRLPSE
jgi:uncharacterized protein (TIGR00369 family)